MRPATFQPIFFLLAAITSILTSCDYTMYVAVANHTSATKVKVRYANSGHIWDNKDTLRIRGPHVGVDSFVVRTNIDSSSYYFIAPPDTEIQLLPVSLGSPIRRIEFMGDSSWSYETNSSNKIRKALKKRGLIETSGFPFTYKIIYHNR